MSELRRPELLAGQPPVEGELFVLNAMRDLKLSQLRALSLLNSHPTLDRAASESNETYNTLKAQLLALDKWFGGNLSVRLITRNADNHYELTPQGRAVAVHVERIEHALRDMIDASGSPEVRVNIPCTSDCLEQFVAARDAMTSDGDNDAIARMEVSVYAVASADFAPFSDALAARPVLSFGPIFTRSEHLELPADVDHLVLDEHPIVAITNDPDVRWPHRASVAELLEMRPRIVMPSGGVVWQFMNHAAAGTQWRLNNGAHMPVHDVHFGLRALSTRAEPRALMLVHGLERALAQGDVRYPQLPHLQVTELTDSRPDGPRAVTGLFYNRQAQAQRVPKFAAACDRFWEAAQRTLPTRPQAIGGNDDVQ